MMGWKDFYKNSFPIREKQGNVQTRAVKWIQKNIVPGSKILEFGCNTGINLACLKDNYDVTGIDISIMAYNNRTVDNIILGDESKLMGFGANHFDFAFTVSTLCHIEKDVQRLIRQISAHQLFVETETVHDSNYFRHKYSGKRVFTVKSKGNGVVYRGDFA